MKKIKKTSSGHRDSHHFIVPLKYYVFTVISLIVLTGFTIYTAKMWHLPGYFGIALVMVIAIIKASLVVMFFMGLKWDKELNLLFLLGTLFFIITFIGITLFDYASRTWISPWGDKINTIKSPVQQYETNKSNKVH